jgi:hypothetical protein
MLPNPFYKKNQSQVLMNFEIRRKKKCRSFGDPHFFSIILSDVILNYFFIKGWEI